MRNLVKGSHIFGILFFMTTKEKILQQDYTIFESGYQGKIEIDFAAYIPHDAEVRLINQIGDELDYTELLTTYSHLGRKPSVPPKIMFKLWLYAYVMCHYSCRDIYKLCTRDIHAIWLLEGNVAPHYTTFANFRSTNLVDGVLENLFIQFVEILISIDEIDLKQAFFDGSKFEAYANRYTFVWKKSIQYHLGNLHEKIKKILPTFNARYSLDIEFYPKTIEDSLQRCRRILRASIEIKGIKLVYGKGRRKTVEQRLLETADEYYFKLKEYHMWLKLIGEGRSSLSKTDTGATFMRMKDDHMKNGQLKPAYNVQIAVQAEYIIWTELYQNANDVNTFIPFIKSMPESFQDRLEKAIADAGFESEENYQFLEEHGIEAFIKPSNYEQAKKRSFKKQIGRVDNMEYDDETDSYICANGQRLTMKTTSQKKSSTGYVSETTIYESASCKDCPLRSQCMKSKNEEYNKQIRVSREFVRYREQSHANITSNEGILLRINRSIQVEGAFGVIKEDSIFRRFFLRGMKKTSMEFMLLSFAFNIKKLHNRIQDDRIGLQLFR